MPIYSLALKVPTTATELNPVETRFQVLGDYITRVMVIFPAGPNWHTKVAVFYGIKKIYPFEQPQWFMGNNETINFETLDRLPDPLTWLRFVGWNDGGIYPHTIGLRIVTSWEWQIRERVLYEELIKRLDYLLRRIGVV